MKIIPPYQITSEILNLINEAEEYIVLVSPYVNFKKWERIQTDIVNAIKKGVKIAFYTRLESDNINSIEQIEQLGIKPRLIKNLHAKIYFNEKVGIVTSMNLLTSSNLNAIEFGSIYQKPEELSELKSFIKKYLEPNISYERPSEDDIYLSKEKFTVILSNFLSNNLGQNIYAKWRNGIIEFNANNKYYLEIDKGNNLVSCSGIISSVEYENFDSFKKKYYFDGFKTYVNDSSIYIESQFKLSNSNVNFISVFEKKRLLEVTLQFVISLSNYKYDCYKNKKQ